MKRWLGLGLPFAIVAVLVGWRISAEKGQAAELEQQQKARSGSTPAVEVARAESRDIAQTLEVVGNVESPFIVRLSPKFAGRITMLNVREGDRVEAGQPLVTIDPEEIDAQVLQQQASVSEARSRLAQAQMTSGATEAGVQSEIRVKTAAVTSAQAALDRDTRSYDAEVSAAESAVTDSEARVAAAEAEVRQRRADLASAQASERNSKARLDRMTNLLQRGFVAEQAVDDARERHAVDSARVGVVQNQVSGAESAVRSAKAQQNAAEKRLAVVKEQGRAAIAAGKAFLEQAKAELDEALANRSQTPAYRENLRALQANVAAAEAGLKQFAARRQDTVLSSPISGTVTSRNADPGSLATPGQTLVTIESLEWVFVDAAILVDFSSQVHQGQVVQVRIDAFPDRVFTGKIAQINRSADALSRQFGIKVRLDNPDEALRPGMFARLELVLSTVRAPVVVPESAVVSGPNGQTVTVIDDESVASIRKVKTGASDRKGIEILEGLRAGERVVVLSYSPVRGGQKVRVGPPSEETKS